MSNSSNEKTSPDKLGIMIKAGNGVGEIHIQPNHKRIGDVSSPSLPPPPPPINFPQNLWKKEFVQKIRRERWRRERERERERERKEKITALNSVGADVKRRWSLLLCTAHKF